MDRKVIDVIKQLREKDVYIRGLRAWAGFRQVGVNYVSDLPDKNYQRYDGPGTNVFVQIVGTELAP